MTDRSENIKRLQAKLNALGESLTVDGDYGPKTESAAMRRLPASERPEPILPVGQHGSGAPWHDEAKKDKGKHETDKDLQAKFVPFWKKLFGLNIKTLVGRSAAFCGLGVGVWLYLAGYEIQNNGAAAKNWAKYGQGIEWQKAGIPKGAIVQLNHAHKCGSVGNNHVGLADADCAPADLLKSGATIPIFGANQGNMVKRSIYSVKEICAVRWPDKDDEGKPVALPGAITRSFGCGGSADSGESTR